MFRPKQLASVLLLVALAALAVSRGWRARFETSLWVDEVYTLQIVHLEVARWLLYAGLATLALWCHLLSAVVFFWLAVAWAVVAMAPKAEGDALRGPGRYRLRGAVSHLLAVALIVPWLVRLPGQLGELAAGDRSWMTAATGRHLLEVFFYWLPVGRYGAPFAGSTALFSIAGVLSLLVPVLGSVYVRRAKSGGSRAATAAASLGLGVALATIGTLWLLARYGGVGVFHGPRYPALVAPLWALGLTGLALRVGEASGTRWLSWLLLAPWLLVGWGAQGAATLAERSGSLASYRKEIAAWRAAPRKPVFLQPAALEPFYRRSLAGLEVHPASDLPCHLSAGGGGTVLDVSSWKQLDTVAEQILSEALGRGALSSLSRSHRIENPTLDVEVVELAGDATPLARELCQRGLRPRPPDIPADALAVGLPEAQLFADGWSFLEISPELSTRRWSAATRTLLRLRGELPAGEHRLHLRGWRAAEPAETVDLGLRWGGEERTLELGPGMFDVAVDGHFGRPQTDPTAEIWHPLWSPATSSASEDRRSLGFVLLAAWVESSNAAAGSH